MYMEVHSDTIIVVMITASNPSGRNSASFFNKSATSQFNHDIMMIKMNRFGIGNIPCSIKGYPLPIFTDIFIAHFIAERLFGNARFRIVPEGKHAGATLHLEEYLEAVLPD